MEHSPGGSPIALDVLIVGGGLCGLATAISVALAGHKATVFEVAGSPYQVGSGIQSSPNGTRLLQRWGLHDALKPVAIAPKLLQVHSFDGKHLARREKYEDEVFRQYGSPLWTFLRVDLQSSLYRRAIELGVKVHNSSRVTDLDGTKPGIKLENGEKYHGDLVVVADGTWSALRSKVLEKTINPQPTGDIACRITIDQAQIEDEEVLKLITQSETRLWVGPDSYAIGYPIRDGMQYSVLLLIPDELHIRNLRFRAIIEHMRKRLEKWDPILATILDVAQRVNKWQLMQVPPPPTFISSHATCVLAGDSCHSIPPFLGQSLNLGLEDAATFGCLLSHVKYAEQLPKATALYDHLRTVRANKLFDETDVYRNELRLGYGKLQERRGGGTTLSLNDDSDWVSPKAQEWIWSYDAYEEAEKAYLNEPY